MSSYVVYVYADYRKEVEIKILKVFNTKQLAINYTKSITKTKWNDDNKHDEQEDEYTTAHDSCYDNPAIKSKEWECYFSPRVCVQEVKD